VKRRVEEHLQKKGIKNDSLVMYFKSFLILSMWIVSLYFSMIQGYILAAFVFGFFHSHLGISIAHDGNHGSYSRNKYINYIARFMVDIMGGSWIIWTMQHNIGHHPHANRQGDYQDEDFDPDSRSGFPMVRLSPFFPAKPHHRFQHIYIWFLFGFVGIKWMYGDIKYFIKGKYQTMDFWTFSKQEFMIQLVTKGIFFFHSLILPIYLHGLIRALIMCCILFAVNSYVFSLLFAVNHLTDEAIFPDDQLPEKDWAKLQVLTSSNYSLNSTFSLWMSGGLNYQIEHHLFPYVCHVNLPEIASIVKQTCKQYEVRYTCFTSYWEALYSYYLHLKRMGNPSSDEKLKAH